MSASSPGPLRTRRRRRVASALRHLMGGRDAPATDPGLVPDPVPDAVWGRLLGLAAEAGLAPGDADPAELLARLDLDAVIPADVAAAICAALLPILESSASRGPQ